MEKDNLEKEIDENKDDTNSDSKASTSIMPYDADGNRKSGPPELASAKEIEACLNFFGQCSPTEQENFVKDLLLQMNDNQHRDIYNFCTTLFQRDFITLLLSKGLDHVAEKILRYLDSESLLMAESVCKTWLQVIKNGMIWKRLIENHVSNNTVWRKLVKRLGCMDDLFKPRSESQGNEFYRRLYPEILNAIEKIENNWEVGLYTMRRIQCNSGVLRGVYCLQYDDDKIVCGLRNQTIRIYDKTTLQCMKVFLGHEGSVLCLDFDDNIIISGSSDSTIRIWDIKTGELIKTFRQPHSDSVSCLRLKNSMLATGSKDCTIAIFHISSPSEVTLGSVLVGHSASVNVVDFDERYIVSAGGETTIRVWSTSTSQLVRILSGHDRSIACLQYNGELIVSGGADMTIRIWNVEYVNCLRVLSGHFGLVRSVRFDSKRIVSGGYDGKIKIWDLKAALDVKVPSEEACIKTLMGHTSRVFRLEFDEFEILSCSYDDTILIWNFLDPIL